MDSTRYVIVKDVFKKVWVKVTFLSLIVFVLFNVGTRERLIKRV